jgi:hypothetical protein
MPQPPYAGPSIGSDAAAIRAENAMVLPPR